MTGVVLFLALLLVLFAMITSVANRIPKTGRCFDAAGEQITAVITNSNPTAEKAATLRAKGPDGKKYKVKIKASEAKPWIKGDSINIILSEKSKEYRILFHEYFKENEPRMRENAIEELDKKINPDFIAGKLVGYKKEHLEAFRASEAESLTVFAFTTYMRMLDIYTIVSALFAVLFVFWYLKIRPSFFELLVPLIFVVLLFYILSSVVNNCKKILMKIGVELPKKK